MSSHDEVDEPAGKVSRSLSTLSSSSSNYEEESEQTEEDKEIALLYELEQTPEIACRFTEGDPEFAKELASSWPPPPVVTPWRGSFRGGRGGGGSWRGGDNRKRHNDNGDDYNREKWRRSDGYNRNDRNQGYRQRDQHNNFRGGGGRY